MISVIVPVFQAEKYLSSCVESLISQTLQDLELILVDDGSTDESPSLCDQYAEQYDWIHVIHQENRGVSEARNTGIRTAKGEYLAFVDADDWVEADFLELLHGALADDVDVSLCGMEDGQNVRLMRKKITISEFQSNPSLYLFHVYVSFASNKLYRRSIICENHVEFHPGMRRGEDSCFVMEYLSHSRCVSFVPKICYHYRQHTGSAMHCIDSSAFADECFLMEKQYDFFHQQPLGNEESAYLLWEYGKTLSVMRSAAVGSLEDFRRYLEILQTQPRYVWSIQNPPRNAGKKGQLAALFWKTRQIRLLKYLLRIM